MAERRILLLSTIADLYLKNPFFILDSSGEKDPLLHQTETLARCIFLKPTRILVADVIGLGKTVTALRIYEMLRLYDKASKALIIVPSVLLPQWLEELKHFGIIPSIVGRKELEKLSRYTALPSGVYISTIDRLKRDEYFKIIEKEHWDLVIVDEAQKLGFVGHRPTQRWEVLGNFIARLKTANVILLSATPHKGYDDDYLARLYIVDPSLSSLGSPNALKRISRSIDRSFYETTHYVVIHRRTKSDINEIYEQREVFKRCYMLAVLVKPSKHEEDMLSNMIKVGEKGLAQYYNELASKGYIDPAKVNGAIRLLRKLIIKRGLSSPVALFKTFSKMIKKREEIMKRLREDEELEDVKRVVEEKILEFEGKLENALDPEAEYGDEGEEEPDAVFDEIADSVAVLLPRRYVEAVREAVSIATKIERGELPDSKLETLKQIIEDTFGEHEEKFRDLKDAKIVVFTEFKDTAEYVYSRLVEWFKSRYGDRAEEMVKIITSENRGSYEEIIKWFRKSPYSKVLVTTDILGEGLNLQAANVLVNYEVTYSPIRLEQRIGRIWRYGQGRDCYVFNLFYIHRYEEDVARTIFKKLYGINDAVGKQELSLGDEVYISAVGDSLFEKTVRERLGKEYAKGYSRYLGGLIPVAVKHRGREVSLTESSIIDAIFEGELEEFVEEFLRTILDLARRVRENRIYPEPLTREAVERFLRQSFGIGNYEEAEYIATKLVELYDRIAGTQHRSFTSHRRPDIYLKYVRDRGKILDPDSGKLYLILPSNKKVIYILAVALVEVRSETLKEQVGVRVYREPVLVELDVEGKKANVYRGRDMVDTLYKLLPHALEVDEVYGVDEIAEEEWSRAINFVRTKILNNYYPSSIDHNDMVKRIETYENMKKNIGASNLFKCSVTVSDIKPLCFLVSVGVFPESRPRSATDVWFGFEDQYLREVVIKYERSKGREPDITMRKEEHYDVYSYSEDEERYIEAKGFVKPRLEIRLTAKEYEKAKELGDRFWLYLAYGVGTEKPVILCIRNPAEKLKLSKREVSIVREEYIWSRWLEL